MFRSMEIETGDGGLTAMSREDQNGYGVNDTRIPANGKGVIAMAGARYQVRTQEGVLAGTRFDGAVAPETDHMTDGPGVPR